MSLERRFPTYEAIRRLLFDEWNPIGGHPPDDEYDQYAMGAWSRLEKKAGVDEIAAYLLSAERENMGLSGDHALMESKALLLATKIVALRN